MKLIHVRISGDLGSPMLPTRAVSVTDAETGLRIPVTKIRSLTFDPNGVVRAELEVIVASLDLAAVASVEEK